MATALGCIRSAHLIDNHSPTHLVNGVEVASLAGSGLSGAFPKEMTALSNLRTSCRLEFVCF